MKKERVYMELYIDAVDIYDDWNYDESDVDGTPTGWVVTAFDVVEVQQDEKGDWVQV